MTNAMNVAIKNSLDHRSQSRHGRALVRWIAGSQPSCRGTWQRWHDVAESPDAVRRGWQG